MNPLKGVNGFILGQSYKFVDFSMFFNHLSQLILKMAIMNTAGPDL